MNHLPNSIISKSLPALFILAGTFLTSYVVAQDAASEEVFELSPFVIQADDDEGWIAGSTLIGTRTRTSLSDLPISVDAITSEFLDDMGINSVIEAAEWVAGVETTDYLNSSNDDNMTSFRGLETGGRENAQSSRNFFLWYSRSDTYNIERIDFNKGSNSLMFGDASPGGVATTYTKRAHTNRNFGSVTARYGSYDSYRLMFDYNHAISEKFALRLNLVDRATRTHVDFWDDQLQGGHIAGTYKPFKDTLIRFEAEKLEFYRTRGSNRIEVDQRAGDDGGFAATSSSRQVLTSDGDYYDPREEMFYESDGSGGFLDPYFLDRRSGPTGDNLPLADGLVAEVRRRDSPSPVFVTLGPLDPSTNVKGNFSFLERNVDDQSIWIEQKLGDLYLELAYNHQDQIQNRDDSGFSDTLQVDWDGRVFSRGDYSYKWYGNETNIFRLTGAYPIETKWFSQYIVANASYQDDLALSLRRRLVNKAKAYDPDTGEYDVTTDLVGSHRIRFRNYWDDLENPVASSLYLPENMPVVPGVFEPMWVDYTTENKPYNDKRYTRTASLSASGEYFGGKIRSLFGIRHDAFKLKRYILPGGSISDLIDDYGELAWWGQDVYLGKPDEAPEQYEYMADLDQEDTTYTAGVVYELTDSINLYANKSTSFRWQGTEDFLGRPLGPQTGDTKEFGFKTSLFDDYLVMDAAYYEIERSNVAYRLGSGNNANELELLFNDVAIDIEPDGAMVYYPAEPGDPGFVEIPRGLNSEHLQVTANEETSGYELTVRLRRWHGLQLRLSLAYVDIQSARDLVEYNTYVEAAAAREVARAAIVDQYWTSDPNWEEGELPDIEEDLRDSLEYAQEQVEANSGLGRIEGSRARPWRFSWVMDYEMSEDFFLPELRIILSGSYRDNYLLDINDGLDWIGGSTHVTNLSVQYKTQIMDYQTYFQVNIRNLTDFENDDIRESGGFVDSFTDEPTWRYRNVTPTSVDFTVTVKF